MKLNPKVTISRRKNRKAHFDLSQFNRQKRMSSTLSKELRAKHSFRSFPIVKNDEVSVISGRYKGRSGKVVRICRREYKVYVETCERTVNGGRLADGIDASNLKITRLCEDFGRKERIAEKSKAYRAKKEEVALRDQAN